MLAIIWNPRLDKRMGKQIFHYALNRNGATPSKRSANGSEEIELRSVMLNPGTNFVDPEQWAAVVAHKFNTSEIDRMLASQALRIFTPDAEAVVGSTSDFSDLGVVEAIVRSCNDRDWLQRSLARDQRQRVFQVISDHMKQMDDERVARSREFSFI